MPTLARRAWVPTGCEDLVQTIAAAAAESSADAVEARLDALATENSRIHDLECVNLNPATNAINPKAEAMLARGLGSRPSLGYPGDKYEMGLEAIEQIEVIAAELAAETFRARHAEIRLASGAMANLAAFMATTRPGDAIVAPPDSIAGHVTHHRAGAAGLYGLEIHPAPVDATRYTVDLEALGTLVRRVRPRLITIGGSLNLMPHPVREVRALADSVDAVLLFDAAHLCGVIAGGAWPDPLAEGAHLMTMSTYKSLGGPAGGLVVTDDAGLAERLDRIAYPGLTANFDVARSAALAVALLDWREHGAAYARAMADTAQALATALDAENIPVFGRDLGFTRSHQLAVVAAQWGGGQTAAKRLRRANILASGIGLPAAAGAADGLRLGTPEIVRRGMRPGDMAELAALIARALTGEPDAVAEDTVRFRQRFTGLHYVR